MLHDKDLCIGCGYCFYACPFGAPQYPRVGNFGGRGKMDKCTYCAGGPQQDNSRGRVHPVRRQPHRRGQAAALRRDVLTKALLAGDGDIIASIYRERVQRRGYGSGAWGWRTAYKETLTDMMRAPRRAARGRCCSPSPGGRPGAAAGRPGSLRAGAPEVQSAAPEVGAGRGGAGNASRRNHGASRRRPGGRERRAGRRERAAPHAGRADRRAAAAHRARRRSAAEELELQRTLQGGVIEGRVSIPEPVRRRPDPAGRPRLAGFRNRALTWLGAIVGARHARVLAGLFYLAAGQTRIEAGRAGPQHPALQLAGARQPLDGRHQLHHPRPVRAEHHLRRLCAAAGDRAGGLHRR